METEEMLAHTPEAVTPADKVGFEAVLTGLKAAGEHTRLRILAVLAEGELTVSELCRILGQTQPRVSRHLKLLGEAGLLDRHTEGTKAFFGPTRSRPGRAVFEAVLDLIDLDDAVAVADRRRLATIRAERAEAAERYFEEIAGRWDDVRSLLVADAAVEEALLSSVVDHRIDGRPIESLLDIGTGTGRILEIFADRVAHGLGIDSSSAMLNLARSNLTAGDLDHLAVRHGNAYALDVAPASFDLAVLHHVLHFLDDPGAALTTAAGAIRPGGLLIVVDFAPHQLETLRTDHAHHRLGFGDDEVADWCRQAGLDSPTITHFTPHPDPTSDDTTDDGETLTVTMWIATRTADETEATT